MESSAERHGSSAGAESWVRRIGSVLVTIAFLAAPAAAQDLDAGLADFANKRYSRAFKTLEPLSATGVQEAQLAVGKMLLLGKGTEQDSARGIEMLDSLATESPEAAFILGEYYFEKRQGLRAMPYLERAAAAGDGAAMEMIGELYRGGRDIDYSEADMARWFAKAIESGSVSPWTAMLSGLTALKRKNYELAVEHFGIAADKGNLRAVAELGRLYYEGLGTSRDLSEAHRRLLPAAAAHYALGELYLGDVFVAMGQPIRGLECYGAALIDGKREENPEVMKIAWQKLLPFGILGNAGVRVEKPDGPCDFEPSELMLMLVESYFSGK
ncbi:tetratricopeptide repeat protein [Nitratireductor luteus]|uniref:tetratricopeptide repeat protein n=1 Tax=Nitratireductor luteus TaxID=2976980 RepID=UPI00223F0A1E|nr:tetratricopeptide repeat protein [Nitratireductor luteus]